MTRHQRFDVRVAPEVERELRRLAEHGGAAGIEARHVRRALAQLSVGGTRASGARKLRALDLCEIRAGDHRLFFSPVGGTRQLAVPAIVHKTTRRLPMRRLRDIELKAHRWRDTNKEMP